MKIEEFREGMYVVNEFNYLNHASIGPLHEKTLETVKNVANSQSYGTVNANFNLVMESYQSVRNEVAKLIQANVSEISLITTVAHGVSLILESLNWTNQNQFKNKGMIINDLEFPSNNYGYQQVSKKFGNPLHVVQNLEGKLDLERFEKILREEQVGLVGISHVQFGNGFKINLAKLKKLCHHYGALLLVDSIQSSGVLKTVAQDCDFMIAGSYKWCLGPQTTGFLYVDLKNKDILDPIFVSPTSDKNMIDFNYRKFNPFDDARVFQSIIQPQWEGMGVAINLINQIGISNIESKVIKLIDYAVSLIWDKLPGHKIKYLGENDADKSGILNIAINEVKDLGKIVQLLGNDKIIVSTRDNGIRISPHFYNTFEEIEQFVTSLSSILKNI